MAEFFQFLVSGLNVGAVYALVALGFTLIYAASDVINFAQGEFVMIGGMATVFLAAAGLPLPLAAILAVAAAAAAGLAVALLAVAPARGASPVSVIVVTIGASLFLKGVAQIIFDKQVHSLPAFSGDAPFLVFGAVVQPQSLWVLGGAAAVVLTIYVFLERTLLGKALLATSANRLAARLVGVDTRKIMALSFAASGAIGALAGLLITPIALTSYDVGALLALKGFAAAMLGGMGSPFGAALGGLLLGLFEAFAAGYLSSAYKDATAFVIILLVLSFKPSGLFGRRGAERA